MREQDIPILETYAEALAEVAREAGQLDAAFDEARALTALLEAQPGLLRLLERPAIEKEDKRALLRRVFDGHLSPVMLNLGLLLVDKNRGGLWREILLRFVADVERRRGIHSAQISTARPLEPDQKVRLKAGLERFTGHRLRIEYREDAALIGGVLFRSGDTMIDSTLRGAIKELRERLDAVKID